MSALGTNSLDISLDIHEQDLAILNALHLDLLLRARREVEGREVLDLVFLSHWSASGERSR
jgi:hypothetical protein